MVGPMASPLRLLPEARASGRARAFLARELADQPGGDALATAQLLVSELVTNAVVHAASAVEVHCERDDSGITVRVRDADTGPLVLSAPATLAGASGSDLWEGGRGLLLVDQLSDAWGTEHQGGRKTVWFRLSLARDGEAASEPQPAPRDDALDDEPALRTAERRLGTLLLPQPLRQVLNFDQQLVELLTRVVEAVGAAGGQVWWAASERPLASLGQTDGLPAHSNELGLADRHLGTLTIYGDGLDDEDKAFIRVASERLSLLAYEHGVLRAGDEREAELDHLSEATELLTTAVSIGASLTLLTQLVVPRLGDWSAAFAVDERGGAHRVAANHRREERADALVELLDHDGELLTAVRDAAAGAPAHRLPITVTVGGQRSSVAVVPLVSRSRTLGVLMLGRAQPLDAMGLASLLELSRRAGLAIDNARLHEEQTAAATALQAALLPPALPLVDGIQLAARYHSASPGMLVGGDFYDAFALSDGSIVCAIGDVCGKGAEAAAVTGMSRDLIRLLLRDGHELATALQRLNRALLDDARNSRFCTIALARLAYVGGVIDARICLAGHPEPVLLHADGTTEMVGTPGDLLGVIDGELELHEYPMKLRPGEALVFYTDGITERRSGSRMFGHYGVQHTLQRAAGADAATLAAEVESAARSFVDTELRDDLALLVVQHLPLGADIRAKVAPRTDGSS
jgi:phosphoserine phosphatase RsbU/P